MSVHHVRHEPPPPRFRVYFTKNPDDVQWRTLVAESAAICYNISKLHKEPDMNTDMNMQDGDAAIPPHAVSVYGQGAGALDDFPVLKAFQQYVDAEQAKAHKRLMTVCVFFTVLILTVIGVFMFIILNLSQGAGGKDQSADATIKALSDNNAALQSQVLEQTRKMNEQLMAQLAAKQTQPAADAELQKQNFELQAKLNALEIEKRLRAEQEAEAVRRAALAPKPEPADASSASEKEKADMDLALKKAEQKQQSKEAKLREREAQLAAEEKRLREKEISLQRRRLYPEYFDEDGNELPAPVRKPRPNHVSKPAAQTPDPEQDLDFEPEQKPEPKQEPTPAQKPAAKRKPEPKYDDIDALDELLNATPARHSEPVRQSDGSMRYFDEEGDDEAPHRKAQPPAPKKQSDGSLRFFEDSAEVGVGGGADSSWTIPLE